MSVIPSVAGFVLAGGRSSRMGRDKAQLEIAGQPLLLRAINLLKGHVDDVRVIGPVGRYDFVRVPTIPDQWPGRGPLAAIFTALEETTSDWNIFLACDLPLLNNRFIELLLRLASASHSDAVVPRTTTGWQPLCAAYRRTSIGYLREALNEGESAIIKVIPRLRVDSIAGEQLAAAGLDESIFENLNDPEDLERIRELLNAKQPC